MGVVVKSAHRMLRVLFRTLLTFAMMALFIASPALVRVDGDDLWAMGFSRVGADNLVRALLPTAGPVRLTVHDAAGRRVSTLLDTDLAAGRHAVAWSGRDDRGRIVATGTYLYSLQTAAGTESKKMVLLK